MPENSISKGTIILCMHIRIHGYKDNLNPDDTYDLLKNVKREGESFSDFIDRLLKKEQGNLSDYFGALENNEV